MIVENHGAPVVSETEWRWFQLPVVVDPDFALLEHNVIYQMLRRKADALKKDIESVRVQPD